MINPAYIFIPFLFIIVGWSGFCFLTQYLWEDSGKKADDWKRHSGFMFWSGFGIFTTILLCLGVL